MLEILSKLEDFSLRELDILVAKFFYKFDTRVDRVDAKNSNNIRYLFLPKDTKKVRFRGYSRVKSKLEKEDVRWRPLPRYSVDIRDFYTFVKDFISRYSCKVSITLLDKTNAVVVIYGETLTGKLCDVGVRLMLAYTIEKEKY